MRCYDPNSFRATCIDASRADDFSLDFTSCFHSFLALLIFLHSHFDCTCSYSHFGSHDTARLFHTVTWTHHPFLRSSLTSFWWFLSSRVFMNDSSLIPSILASDALRSLLSINTSSWQPIATLFLKIIPPSISDQKEPHIPTCNDVYYHMWWTKIRAVSSPTFHHCYPIPLP